MNEPIRDSEMSQVTRYQGQHMMFPHNLKGRVNGTWGSDATINSCQNLIHDGEFSP